MVAHTISEEEEEEEAVIHARSPLAGWGEGKEGPLAFLPSRVRVLLCSFSPQRRSLARSLGRGRFCNLGEMNLLLLKKVRITVAQTDGAALRASSFAVACLPGGDC